MKGFKSPYYDESHLKLKLDIRKFVVDNVYIKIIQIMPFADDWEESGKIPT